MYKIEQLSSLVEKMEHPSMELPENLVNFVKALTHIELEFQKIDTFYNMEITPGKSPIGEPVIAFSLKFEDKKIYNYVTTMPFYKYQEAPDYESVDYHANTGSLVSNVQKEVTFDKDPDLYKQIVEDQLIKCFLHNENENKNRESLNKKFRY